MNLPAKYSIPGKWDAEPDHEEFTTAAGLRAVIQRVSHSGHLCGYVEVPRDHALHGVSYSAPAPASMDATVDRIMSGTIGKRGIIDVMCHAGRDRATAGILFDVHGGITFSDDYAPGRNKTAGEWWYGFDCAHAGDVCPGYACRYVGDPSDTYRGIEYVRAECESLARQIAETLA